MSDDITEFTWLLGADSDCETCGYTMNQLGLDLWDEDNNVWQLYFSVGCYGGDNVLSDSPEWEQKSLDIINQALWYPGFSEDNAKELRKKIKSINEKRER